MFRKSIVLVLVFIVSLLSLTLAGGLARNVQVPPDATPGSEGVTSVILGAVDSAVAPGQRLVMAEVVFAPGAYATQHSHPTAIVVCVKSGALGFAIQQGTASITRDGAERPETLELDTEVTLEPRDCVAFDHFATHTAHTGWNASEEPTILWEARLFAIDEPFTVFVNEEGTPVP